MHEHSVLTASVVRWVAAHAQQAELNRQLDRDTLLNLDPHGFSIASMVLPNHDRSGNPNVKQPDPPHHRVKVLLKMKDTKEPLHAFMDILAADWDKLPETETTTNYAQDRG